MRTSTLLGLLAPSLLLACDGAVGPDPAAPGDPAPPEEGPPVVSDCEDGPQEVDEGNVAGTWCDEVHVRGSLRIPSGHTLVLAPGTRVTVDNDVRIFVEGTLDLQGEANAPVTLEGPSGWAGISVDGGVLTGTHVDVIGRMAVLRMSAGEITLTDSVLDLQNPELTPDCTNINGGDLTLEHVRITGCHCPIHVNAADAVDIRRSIFDGAAVPVMIAHTSGVLVESHLLGSGDALQDIGGGLDLDVSDNYWDGGPPDIRTTDPSQFTGTDAWSSTPLPGVGPRR